MKARKLLAIFIVAAMIFTLNITAFAAPAPDNTLCDDCDFCTVCGGLDNDCGNAGNAAGGTPDGTCENDADDTDQACDCPILGVDAPCTDCGAVCGDCGFPAVCNAVDGSSDPDPCAYFLGITACPNDGSCAAAGGTNPFVPPSTTIDGDGDKIWVDHVFTVTLPTAAMFNFTMDPQGLLGIPEDGKATPEELEPFAGKIVGGAPATVLNLSSVPAVVTANFQFVAGTSGLNVMTTGKAAVQTGTGLNAQLYVAPAKNVITTVAGAPTQYVATDMGYTVSAIAKDQAGASSMQFLLAAAPYELVNTGGTFSRQLVTTATGNGTAFAVGGWVNPGADWTTFDDTDVKLRVIFDIAPIAGQTAAQNTVAHGLIAAPTGMGTVTHELAPPGPTATVTLSGLNVSVTASGFTFPATATSFVAVNGAGTAVSFTNVPAFTGGGTSTLSFAMPAAWGLAPGGAQNGWTKITITYPTGVLVIDKASINATTGTATITIP